MQDAEDKKAAEERAARDSLFLVATLYFPDNGQDCSAKVRNLSKGGMMAEGPIRTASGDRVEIALRNIGTVTGKVAWVAEGRFGIAFDTEIDPVLARKPVGQGQKETPRYARPAITGRVGLR